MPDPSMAQVLSFLFVFLAAFDVRNPMWLLELRYENSEIWSTCFGLKLPQRLCPVPESAHQELEIAHLAQFDVCRQAHTHLERQGLSIFQDK